MGLGEFDMDAYEAQPYKRLFFIVFIAATFLITIVFLNMMIAIMGDTFAMATEQRAKKARLQELDKMGDYVHVIPKKVA